MLTVKNNSIKNKFKWTIAHTPLSKSCKCRKKSFLKVLSKKMAMKSQNPVINISAI